MNNKLTKKVIKSTGCCRLYKYWNVLTESKMPVGFIIQLLRMKKFIKNRRINIWNVIFSNKLVENYISLSIATLLPEAGELGILFILKRGLVVDVLISLFFNQTQTKLKNLYSI